MREINDLVRGACGGFLFGIPMLYTMEVWWIGASTQAPILLVVLAATLLVIYFLNQTGGFRQAQTMTIKAALMDSVEAIAIGLLCAALMLILLRQITLETQLSGAIGQIIFEGVPFSIGVALANQFLSNSPEPTDSGTDQEPTAPPFISATRGDRGLPSALLPKRSSSQSLHATLADIGATLVGAIIIAFNIAPTDEIPMLVAAVSGPWLLVMVIVSLLISYGIVFQASFANQRKRIDQRGLFQTPLSETVVSYLISLLAAALMLWFFQKLHVSDSWQQWLRYTLLLGLPATIGGAAGRLAI